MKKSIQHLIDNNVEFAKWKLPYAKNYSYTDLSKTNSRFKIEPFKENLSKKASPTNTTKKNYLELIKKTVDHIKTGTCDKIIISRTKKIKRSREDLDTIFSNLCEKYEDAFVYVFHHKKHGTWIGASPEKLLLREGKRCQTVALAGTKKTNKSIEWKQKEIAEHQFVVDDILEKIQLIGQLTNQEPTITIKAGEVEHLKTEFDFNTNLTTTQILEHLHPTPAICGTPRQKALEFIHYNEPHSRKCYTGHIGIIENNIEHYYVNLRCMKVNHENFVLYLGGGITKSSVPEKEWEETENKAKTLLSVIQNS